MKKIRQSLYKIALPVTLQSMLQASFAIIDQLMIGQLGETSISAVGLGCNYSLIFEVVIGAVCSVAGIMIAQFLGAEDSEEAWRSTSVSTTICLIISSLFTLSSLIGARGILGMYTKDALLIEEGIIYFRFIVLAYIPMGLSMLLATWLRCKEYASIPLYASLLSVFVNTGLNYILIMGKFGIRPMGVAGAGIATLSSQLVNLLMVIIGFIYVCKKEREELLFSLHMRKISRKEYMIMILPILISEFLWSMGQNVESAVYGHLGTESLAAYTLTCPIQGLFIGALSGLAAAAGVIIGKSLGQKEYNQAYDDAKYIMRVGLIGSVILSVLLVILSGVYVSLYHVDTTVMHMGQLLLIVFAIYAPSKVENMILGGGIIKSGGDTKTIMIIDIIGTWLVGIPLCFISAYLLHMNIVGVYAILTSEELVRLAISLVIFKKRKWIISLS